MDKSLFIYLPSNELSKNQRELIEEIEEKAKELLQIIQHHGIDERCYSIALRKLQECVMWIYRGYLS